MTATLRNHPRAEDSIKYFDTVVAARGDLEKTEKELEEIGPSPIKITTIIERKSLEKNRTNKNNVLQF